MADENGKEGEVIKKTLEVTPELVDAIADAVVAKTAVQKNEGGEGGTTPPPAPASTPEPAPAPVADGGEGGTPDGDDTTQKGVDRKPGVLGTTEKGAGQFDNQFGKSFGTTKTIDGLKKGNWRANVVKGLDALNGEGDFSLKDVNAANLEELEKVWENIDDIRKETGIQGLYLNPKAYTSGEDANSGRFLIPDAEFLIGIEKYEKSYGIALANCNVRSTDRRAVKSNRGLDDFEFTRTSEMGEKPEQNLTFEQILIEIEKYTGVLVASDEFVQDQQAGWVDYLMKQIARGRSKKVDQVVFTENGDADHKGLLHDPDTTKKSIGADIDEFSWDDMIAIYYATNEEDREAGRFVMNSEVWAKLITSKSEDDGHYLWTPQLGMKTPFGVDVLTSWLFPTTDTGDANDPYVVFGDLSKIDVWVNGGLVIQTFNSGIANDINLIQQDATAYRAVTRFGKLVHSPERFTVVGTGTIS